MGYVDTHLNYIKYTNLTDTLTANTYHSFSENGDKSCCSPPQKPYCSSKAWATVSMPTNGRCPITAIHTINMQKRSDGLTFTEFNIGNTFDLSVDQNLKLSGSNCQVTTLPSYTYNGVIYLDVQEITLSTPLGTASELTRALYQPSCGVLELTYSNPSETWIKVP
jgi:hypothetical protein